MILQKLYQYKRAFTFLFTVTVLFGCKNIDDIQPQHQLEENNVISDLSSAQSALNGVYVMWRQSDISSVPVNLGALGIEGILLNDSDGFTNNSLDPQNQYLQAIYADHYKIINQANFLIEKMQDKSVAPQISAADRKALIAGAKFNRALANFSMLRYFGQFYDLSSKYGIVLVNDFSRGISYDPRSSVQDVYNSIVEDLQYAAENGAKDTPHYYASDVSAQALLAKVYLYMGQYDDAAQLAEQVINNTEGYKLEDSYADIFKNTDDSSEVLFALYHDATEGGTEMYKISSTNYSNQLQQLADDQVSGAGSLTGDGSGYDPRFEFAYSDNTKGDNGNAKYPFGFFDEGNTQYFMRLAEVYLIYAEAETRATDGDSNKALDALNVIRKRAGVEPKTLSTKAQLLTDIRNEKLLELFFENGEPWFDLIRYQALDDLKISDIKSSIHSDTQLVMPIPLAALQANKNLIQNPGY